jgi:MYXO-CTERM domain-containing protein
MLPRLAPAALLVLVAGPARAQVPTVVDATLTLTGSVAFANAQSARFDPLDPTARWVARRGSSADGLFRIGFTGRVERVAAASNPAALLVDPDTGHVFFSEDFGGIVYRVDASLRPAVRSTWVSGLGAGDDDPIGMRIAPPYYTGGAVRPGQAVLTDRGFNGPDGLWVWTTTIAQRQALLVPDSSALVDGVDVAFDPDFLYLADAAEGAVGRIWRVGAGGTLTDLPLVTPFANPVALAWDPRTGELLVLDSSTAKLVAVDVGTGVARDLLTGITGVGADEYSAIDLRADGSQLLLTTNSMLFTYSRCATGLTPANDCDGSGVLDQCELAQGARTDCNANGVPDVCDVSAGTSPDCDLDGVPDECPACPPVEIVLVFDTSASMDDEAAALCSEAAAIRAELEARGITVSTEILGISATPGGNYACLEGQVMARYGTAVPGNPPPGNDVLGQCPGGNEVASEDWGRAASVVAGTKAWSPGTVRVVVPIADEGPWCGDPVNANDTVSITHAIVTATTAEVRISPITGTGASAAVINLATQLAAATGGVHHPTSAANTDIPQALLTLVRSACFAAVDCNENFVVDSCDIVSGGSLDCDADGVPDECQPVAPSCPDAGVDAGSPDAEVDGGELDAGDEDGGVEVDAGDEDAGDEDAGDEDAALEEDAAVDAGPVEDAAVDAGAADASVDAAVDASADAGRPDATADAGVAPQDSGAADAGLEEAPEDCSCTATQAETSAPAEWGWGFILLALALRRRRR